MRRRVVVIGMSVLLCAFALHAQTPATKPGPEQQRLGIWVGDWTYEAESKATPLGPAGKVIGKMSVRRTLGDFFVEFRGEENGPTGALQWSETDGFDPISKIYVWKSFSSDGSFTTVTYTIGGTAVPYSGTGVTGDKQYKIKGTCTFAADFMSFTEKREISLDGKAWMVLFESKVTKSKSAPK